MAKGQRGTIPREEHASRKRAAKARKKNRKRGDDKPAFILKDAPAVRVKKNYDHTAQMYLERGDIRTAHDLCRGLKAGHTRAVLGMSTPPLNIPSGV